MSAPRVALNYLMRLQVYAWSGVPATMYRAFNGIFERARTGEASLKEGRIAARRKMGV